MAAGLGFKTFTTGEVLTAGDVNGYLMQGVLVFASEAARNAAITSPQEGQFAYTKDNNSLWYYTGSAWAASGATGDIEGVTVTSPLTGGGTSGTVTVGILSGTTSNLGAVQLSDSVSSTSTTLAATANAVKQAYDLAASAGGSSNVAGKNAVLNSNFSVWQRGTSVAAANGSGAYTADRWSAYNASYTISQQATSDTTNLPFITSCARVQRNLAATATNGVNFVQPLESINSKPFIGKVATLSFYARAGANYSSASSALLVFLLGGTGTDQNPNNTYTGQSSIISQTATLTTTWQRFTYTSSAIATTVNELAVQFTSVGVGTAGANDYFEVTGVQLEIAGSASAYSPNAATFQQELAACQRYYIRYQGGDTYIPIANGSTGTTSALYANIYFPVEMRVKPSSVEYLSIEATDGNASITGGTLTMSTGSISQKVVMLLYTKSASFTQYRPYILQGSNSASAYVGFNAEL
jgi:hypothetical protein